MDPSITFRLHALPGERLSADALAKVNGVIPITIGPERYDARVTNIRTENDEDGVTHIQVTAWMEPATVDDPLELQDRIDRHAGLVAAELDAARDAR
jgi:hypothetical protein